MSSTYAEQQDAAELVRCSEAWQAVLVDLFGQFWRYEFAPVNLLLHGTLLTEEERVRAHNEREAERLAQPEVNALMAGRLEGNPSRPLVSLTDWHPVLLELTGSPTSPGSREPFTTAVRSLIVGRVNVLCAISDDQREAFWAVVNPILAEARHLGLRRTPFEVLPDKLVRAEILRHAFEQARLWDSLMLLTLATLAGLDLAEVWTASEDGWGEAMDQLGRDLEQAKPMLSPQRLEQIDLVRSFFRTRKVEVW